MARRSRTEADYRRRILRVQLHLESHLDESWSLEELARIACFAPWHFHRVFRAVAGEPVQEHVRRLKLARAARQLATTRRTVTAIAFDAGYDAAESFTRAFREAFGVSPSAFRAPFADAAGATATATAARKRAARSPRPPTTPPRQVPGVSIQHLEPIRVAFVRHIGPYDEVGEAWQRLFAWAGRQGLLRGPVAHLGICHDDPALSDPRLIRYDACLVLPGDVAPVTADEEVGTRTIPGGDYAVLEHVGDYNTIDDGYRCLYGEWLPFSGREPADSPSFELYVDPPEVAPERRRTRIHLPLT